MNIKRYSELIKFLTFEERYDYLKLNGRVGEDTFGFDRYLNQVFYRSKEWRSVRDFVIARDNGCDLAIDGREIFDKILIHHMNPITKDDGAFSNVKSALARIGAEFVAPLIVQNGPLVQVLNTIREKVNDVRIKIHCCNGYLYNCISGGVFSCGKECI